MENQGIVVNEDEENRPMELTVASVASAALAAMPPNPEPLNEPKLKRVIKPRAKGAAVAAGGPPPSSRDRIAQMKKDLEEHLHRRFRVIFRYHATSFLVQATPFSVIAC